MKCEFASYVREKELSAYHKNEELFIPFTPFPDTASGCRTESLSTLTSCQRSKNLGMNLAQLRNRVAEFLEKSKNHYQNAKQRVDAIKLERDETVDITCAVSDDAIITASNK